MLEVVRMTTAEDCSIIATDLLDKAEVIDLWNTVFKNDPPWNDPTSIIHRKLASQPELFLVGVKTAVLSLQFLEDMMDSEGGYIT